MCPAGRAGISGACRVAALARAGIPAYSRAVHELPIITRVLELSLAAAPEGSEISRIKLRVGSLCDAEPLWLQRYFMIASRGTPAEDAELSVRRDEGTAEEDAAGDPGSAFGYVLESIEVRESPAGKAP